MKKTILISIPILYLLVLLQTSFFIPLNIFGVFPNLVLILVVIVNLFFSRHYWFGASQAFIGGFFLDIFSGNFLGWNVLVLLSIAVFIKVILRKYVQIPSR